MIVMGRIIKPTEIMEQADEIISVMEKDKTKLISALYETNVFINSEELEGSAWSNVKSQIESHNVILRGLICLIDEIILACNGLKINCGEEILDEGVLLEQKGQLQLELLSYYNILGEYRSQFQEYIYDIDFGPRYLEREYINSQALLYKRMIDNNEETIKLIDQKLNKIEEIDLATKNLNNQAEELLSNVNQGIQYIKSTWDSETNRFCPAIGVEGFDWVKELNLAWADRINEDLSGESYSDAEKLELSRNSDKVYLSDDKQSLFYKGVKYSIYVPPQDGKEYLSMQYTTVDTIEDKDLDIHLFNMMFGLELEEPEKENLTNGVQVLQTPQMNKAVGYAFVADAVIGALKNSCSQVDIKIDFQTSSDGKLNRAIICAGTSEQRLNAENGIYGQPVSMYYQNYGSPYAKYVIPKSAYEAYNQRMGGNVEYNSTDIYDYEVILSEQRREADYFSYLRFSEDGALVECPIRFQGERIYITKRNAWRDISGKEVYDLTDEIFQEYTSDTNYCQELIYDNIEGE